MRTTYERFEQLPVWQSAAQLARDVYEFTRTARLRPGLRDQLERAALSVSNNIAEGFERGTTQELITFIYVARGSAAEVRSILCVIEQPPGSGTANPQIPALKSRSESISRQLRAWAQYLQDAAIKGQRHLTNASRRGSSEDGARDGEPARGDRAKGPRRRSPNRSAEPPARSGSGDTGAIDKPDA